MKGLLAEFESSRLEASLTANRGPTLEEKQEALDRIVDAGSTVLEYHASLAPGSDSILSNDHARLTRDLVLDAASECMELAKDGMQLLEIRNKAHAVLALVLRSNPSPAKLSQAVSSVARHYIACVEFWEKKTWRAERIQLAYAVTANLPNTNAEIQQAEEAKLRLHTGSTLMSRFMVLQSRIELARLLIEPRASSFQAPLREMLIGENGRVPLLDALSASVLPAVHRTRGALQTKAGRPLDSIDCSVLQGVMQRLLDFASALPDLLGRLSDDRTGADLPLELLGQIAEGARGTADQVLQLLDLQPTRSSISERPAAAVTATDTTGQAVTERAAPAEGTSTRRKGKSRRKPSAGARSSAPGRPEPQVVSGKSGTAQATEVLSLGNSSSGPSISPHRIADAAPRAGITAGRVLPSLSVDGARAREKSFVGEPRPGDQGPGTSQPDALPTGSQTVGIGEAGSSSSPPQSSHAVGQSSQSSDVGVQRTLAGSQYKRMSYARVVLGADEALGGKSADSSIGPARALTTPRRAASGPQHHSTQGPQGEVTAREKKSLRFHENWRLRDPKPSRSQPDTLPPQEQSEPRPAAGAGRRRFDNVAAQSYNEALLNDALHEISFAPGITEFSCAVVKYDKSLQGQAHHATFLQRAASEFTRQFIPRWEQDVRVRNTWGYATSCNAISRETGGQAGMEACSAMAAQVSRLGSALNDVESKTLSLFVLSFSRYPRVAECRNGMIGIAKVFHEQRGALSELNGQSLALLVNGFSKWPEHENARKAAIAVAAEIRRRPAGLSDFGPQNLANVVNGLSKWPQEAECCGTINAIADEVCHRADKDANLSGFNPQALANLVNGFSKAPELVHSRQATVVIADAVCRRADKDADLSGFHPQDLANLVNGFSKWPEDCRGAIAAIARAVPCAAGELSGFIGQDLANLVNGFSKLQAAECSRASVAIASEVCHRASRPEVGLSDFNPQHLANLVNGFSKLQAAECSRAAVAIAGEVCHRASRREVWLSDFDGQHLANLVNGFSKWPQEENLGHATNIVADEVLRCADQLPMFDAHHLASLVNGFSRWPQSENSYQATVAVAGAVVSRPGRLQGFTGQDLANLVNGFSKWPEDCRGAIVAIARAVARAAGELSGFNELDLANLVNGFSKWPEDCRGAIVAVARQVGGRADQLPVFGPQALANLVNGFSKCPDEAGCGDAVVALAAEVVSRASPSDLLPGFDPQALANLVNGFSKWPQEEKSRQAAAVIAGEVIRSANQLPDFTSQHLSNLVNGFSKWPQEEKSRQATAVIAGEVIRDADRLSGLSSQQLANLLNGFDRCAEEEACSQAVLEIARRLGPAGRPYRHFTTHGLSSIANSLARGVMRREDAGEIAEAALLKDRLHKLAHYLHYASDRIGEADAVAVTSILKALAKAQLHDDLSLLAAPGINRLRQLHQAPGFAVENNLEIMGNICAVLLPLARSPRKQLRWHRRQALNLLNDIQPIVEHKIEAHLRASDAERNRGPNSTRRPALSIYQVLKARANLATLLRRPYVEGSKSDLRVRRDELQSKTKEILDSTRELIESDLSSMSWNLIAQIEAERPIDALDTFVAQNAATVQAQHSASVFDVHQVLRAMDHEPRAPQGEAGLMRLPVVDMQGRQLATDPETRYSIFHRLTSGAVKMVAVQLPGKPSPFMLARTLTVEGVPYRMDLFGGSKLKPPRKTLSQIAAKLPGRGEPEPSGGKLLAIPYAETAPGTSFEKLSRAWAPFKEAYYYTQRRGFAAPPALKDLGPHDYALEGAFKLSLLPDRPASEHPFKLTGREGPIALRPHDGCGFIKASLATRMKAVRLAGGQEGAARVPAFGEGRRSSLPATALQHYPRSEMVANEVREKAKIWLDSRQGQRLTAEELFRTLTSGHIDGPGAVAVPSGDECLHVPTLKSETLTGTNGVLIGRSPYDKPNLRPIATDLVRSAAGGDPTAVFLGACVAMQYSFNVAQKSGEELAADDPTFFAKGILIVVPDEMWPANYADRALVMSAEDVKCHSQWTTGKDRVKEDTALDCLGVLQATEVFAPGSLIAVPTGEQKKLDGDFDGDTVIIIGDRPQLYEHVREFDEKEQALGLPSLKPPKSHTPALDGDTYQFGRASQILAATQDVLETYSGLQRNFLAQSHESRRWFAERAIFGTYEGVHHELRRDIGQLLGREEVSGQDIENLFARARREIEIAQHPVAREMAELLVADLEAWAEGHEVEPAPETVEHAEGTESTTLSAAVSDLLPDLADAYPATSQPKDRIRALIDNYPARIDPRPDGYNPDDLVQSANNLLSLGIKVGTDAYKSNTGAQLFSKKSRDLQRLLHTTPGLRSVPYVKSLATSLNHGSFDFRAALKNLEDNPTLTASVMQTSISLAVDERILREPSGLPPAAANSDETITLTREEASERARSEVARAMKEEGKITAAALNVAASLRKMGIQVKMPHLERRLRSERSIREQLAGTSVSSDSTQQLISNAVRHVFEIPDKDFTRAFKAAILAFEEQDYTEIEVTNWFKFERPAYLGIHAVLATAAGYRFQMEFHTPASYSAKVDNHDTYKELQQLKRRDAPEKTEELEQKVIESYKAVRRPDDVLSITHWSDGKGSVAVAGLRAAGQSRKSEIARPPEATDIVAALGGRPIVLVGMSGAGKSTIGPVLAGRLGLPFIDTDRRIEQKIGKSISAIFREHGEDYFRKLEAGEIAKLLGAGIGVIATGGGAVLNEQTRHLIGSKGLSIWLDTDVDAIRKRTRKDPKRPLLQDPDPDQKLARLMSERRPLYQQANLRFVPPHGNDRKNADPCLKALHAYLCAPNADRSPPGTALRDDIRSAPTPTPPTFDARIGRSDAPASKRPEASVLGTTEWLSDAHIQRDYDFLEQQLQGIDPTLAASIRLVDPSVSHLLRHMELQHARGMLQSIYNRNAAPADFLFLPVNNGTLDGRGTHWSLLLVDRRDPKRQVAYHYDSLQHRRYNDEAATQLAERLDATLAPARMAAQPNDYDCGVFVVDGTRALVKRLVDGERPNHEPLHLDTLIADRQALQSRLTRY
ncbi:shikimate kinase [Sinorhizobium alkalisoli]|uniref:shikimate kinase n=1 Tax=Sinorhizobium alkalisoli TaxID=1752398 RepID=UPI001FE970D7|nr:shikimate kinase [Sinorhizobium alkalisoli]